MLFRSGTRTILKNLCPIVGPLHSADLRNCHNKLQTWATKSSPFRIWLYLKDGHDSLGNGESLKSAAGAWVTKTLGQKFLRPSDIEVFQL